MITSKKKGQISVEALIIVGVLVVGGIIFATVFLSQMNNQAKQASDLSGLTDSFLDDLGGWNTPGTPNIPTVNCIIDEVCQDPPENASNCPDDCGTDGCNGNGFCEASLGEDAANCSDCVAPVFSNFTLNKYVPTGDSAINSKFSLKANIISSYPSVEIYDIMLKKYDDSIMEYVISNKCTIKGVAPDTATGIYPGTLLMTIEDVSLKNQGKIIDEITCSEEGEYRFSAMARPKNVSGISSLSAQVNKIVTSTPTGCAVPGVCGLLDSCPNCPECCLNSTPKFSISIISPTEGQAYFNNQNIQLKAEEIGVGATGISCEWYIDKESIPAEKSCDLSYNLAAFKSGEYKVSVYATREKDGYILTSSDNRNIRIYENDPSAIYLSDPGTQFFGKEFNLKVSSLNEQNVIGASNISFSGINCDIDLTRVSTVFSEEVSGSTVYYKLFPTTCNDVSYSGPGILSPVNAIFNGSNYPFYVGYDLALNFGACSVAGSSYGRLNACVLQTSGSSYNEDYWKPSSYGFLKIAVDVSKNESKNNYGELKVYID